MKSKTTSNRAAASPAPRAGNASGRKELKKSALTRQRILDSAAAIFASKGYGRTLMGDIAQEADIHITALYYHFSTKDDLAEGVINHVARVNHGLMVERVSALPADVPFEDKFRAAVHSQLAGVVELRAYVLAQSKILAELPEERQERHRALLHNAAKFWRDLFQEGLVANVFRDGLDLSIARMILQGSINWTIEWYRPSARNLTQIAAQIADTMLHGIARA